MSEKLSTICFRQVPNHPKHIGYRVFYLGWTFDLWIDLMEHFKNGFTYVRVAGDGFGCCESVH
jgi:hypothetical protein